MRKRKYVAGRGYVDNRSKSVGDSGSNAGDLTVNTEGNLSLGVGSGLSVDLTDGSVGFKVGPVTVDTPSGSDYGSSSSYGE